MAAPRLAQATAINAPFRAPSDGAPPTWLEQLTRPVFLAVFALLLGALVLILLPRAQQADPAVPATPSASTEAGEPGLASVPVPGQALTTVVSPGAVAAAAALPASALAVPLPSRGASAAAPAAAKPASAAAAGGAALPVIAQAVAPSSGIVVFRTKAPSWVEVTDAKGMVAVRKMLSAGEAAAASGALPLQVTIGKVDVTEVQVRGKPFDLRAVSRDNVARFEVR
jgi:cytoskeleton protein RodZ